MAVPYVEIERLLEGVRRRRTRIVLGAAAAFGGAGALLCLLGGAVALGLGAPDGARAAALAGAALALVAAAGWAAWAIVRSAASPEAAARTVGATEPAIRSDLISAVELEREYASIERDQRFSLALVDALIARVGERALAVDLRRVVPGKLALRALAVLAAAVLVNVVSLAVGRSTVAAGYGRLVRGRAPGAAGAPREDPITGDVEVTYVYPEYMARPNKTLSGTGGEVSAPKGTEVTLKTRADRNVASARLVVVSGAEGKAERAYPLAVANGRDLEGGFLVQDGGSYRFEFVKPSARGPAVPIVVEPDNFPEVKITAPAQEVEVDAKARVRVEWTASDDYGLTDLTLVLKPPGGEEQRTVLRKLSGTRREGGGFDLELAPMKLAEGEKLLYWLEVHDNDAVSGPKRAASATQVVKIYSEAEHHRQALDKAQALWEKLVNLLGDRLELASKRGSNWTLDTLSVAETLDARTRQLHEELRVAAADLRKDKATPPELPAALANVASGIREIEERLTTVRESLSRYLRMGRGEDPIFSRRVEDLDAQMTREMEKDVLYLEQLFDKRKAEDLVAMAKDLAARRRDLASMLDKYKQAPSESAKKELLAEMARMKAQMQEMMRRMAELAKGMSDEHMNMEALAELKKSKDMMSQMDRVEQLLAKGDVEGAMKALDAMGNQMQQMLSQLQKTAGEPDQKNQELMKEMLAFKKQLEDVQAEQQKLADETEKSKGEYRKKIAERMKKAEELVNELRKLTEQSRKELADSEKGVSLREEDVYDQARDRLADLDRALGMKDFDAALDMTMKALPSMQRLAMEFEEDAGLAERYDALGGKDTKTLRDAAQHAARSIPPAVKVQDELKKLFPDPRSVLSKEQQQQLGKQAQRQAQLQQQAGKLQQQLEQLMQKAPVFPQGADDMVGESREHMRQAAGDLDQKNPQRGNGQQKMALDSLGRLRRGLDEMAKNMKGQGSQGGGFPFPFGDEQEMAGNDEGDAGSPEQRKVDIPGADQYQVPAEFRKDLLDAMKQGSPEPYKGEVQHYYEELVK